MMLGSRQIQFGMARVPPIEYNNNNNIINGHEKVVEVFSKLFKERFSSEFEFDNNAQDKFDDYIIQTISFLLKIKAIKPIKNHQLKNVKLWKERIELEPFFEGVANSLKSMLIKKHFPSMYEAINKGAIYSHYSLTVVGECVEYIMEFYEICRAFVDIDTVSKNKIVIEWYDKYNKYIKDNKELILKQQKELEKYQEQQLKQLEKALEKIKKLNKKDATNVKVNGELR